MTLSASTASMAAPDSLLFDRTAMMRTYTLLDTSVSYLAGFADGGVYGLALGTTVGRIEGYDRGEEDGQDDGQSTGFRVGTGVSANVSAARTAGAADGDRLGFRRGYQVLQFSSYEHGVEDGIEEGAANAFTMGLLSGTPVDAASGETAPPFIGTVSPVADATPGTAGAFPADFTTARSTPIVVPVVDTEVTVAFVVISALYFDRTTWETVYAGRPADDGSAGFMPGYTAGSAVTGTGDPGVGFSFSVRNDAGWPGRTVVNSTIQFRINAVDSNGNVLA